MTHRVFNSQLDVALRTSVTIWAASPSALGASRLVYYDYLVVHSGDVQGGPTSLHPATPYRGGELVVRRDLIASGLSLLCSRRIARHIESDEGYLYELGDNGAGFVDSLTSSYARRLRERALWLDTSFGQMSDGDVASLVRESSHAADADFVFIDDSPL